MTKTELSERVRNLETVLQIKRNRYRDLVALAEKHASLARDYADRAKAQREAISRTESQLRSTLSMLAKS